MRRGGVGMILVTIVAVVAMVYLLVVPLVVQFITSVRGPFLPFGVPQAAWTLDNYAQLYSVGSGLLDTFVATTVYVTGAAAISLGLGFGLAWLVVRTDLPFRRVIPLLVIVPFVIPPIVQAQSYVLMLAPETGVLNVLLRVLPWWAGERGPIDPFSFASLVVVQGLSSVTFPFLFITPVLQNMDGSLEEAGRAAGASPLQVVRKITIPVLGPALLGVAILQVIFMIGALEIPLLFGQQAGSDLLSLKIWKLLTPTAGSLPRYGLAATYGINFLVVTGIIFWAYRRVTRTAAQRAAITGKGYRPTRYALRHWKLPVLALVALYLLPTTFLPLVALTWTALTPYIMPMTLANLQEFASLDAFRAVLADKEFWASLMRTVVIATAAATISVLLATIVAFVVARSRASRKTQAMDILASSSLAIPGAIAGFSALMLYMVTNPTLHLQGTIWILIMTYSYRMAVAYRTSNAAVLQVSASLEESAAVSGASRLQVLRHIVVPLILPTAGVAWIGSVILNAQEFTLPAFLATPDTRPLSFYLYSRINPGAGQLYAPDQGAATALIFIALVFVVGYLLQRLVGRRAGVSAPTASARRRRAPAAAAPSA